MLAPAFFVRPVTDVAQDLIGIILLVGGVGGPIVETEAYHPSDPASHTFRGRTAANAVMWGPPGHAYVYRSYGLHWCLNVTCGTEPGAAVLIRAIEPLHGEDVMAARRGLADRRLLCAGPGRVCQALGITQALNGAALDQPPFELRPGAGKPDVVAGVRIGITKAADTPWRFGSAGSRFLSRPLSIGSGGQGAAAPFRRDEEVP